MRQVDKSAFGKYQPELLDYSINYGDNWLGSDTVASSSWVISPSGLAKTAEGYDDDKATIWVSGGTVGRAYQLRNTITTAAGRIKLEEITIRIDDYA